LCREPQPLLNARGLVHGSSTKINQMRKYKKEQYNIIYKTEDNKEGIKNKETKHRE
jgi:hypothetical protein